MKDKVLSLLLGVLLGCALFGGGTAMAAGILAEPSAHTVYVDGQRVQMEAYTINGNNYVKLRDMGQAVGFNVYWDGCVQVDSESAYTGQPPADDTVATNSAADADVDALRSRIVALTNALRQSEGVAALSTDDLLTQAAQVRAEELAATGTYVHTRPDGTKYYTVTDCPYMAENIHRISDAFLDAQGLELADYAVDSWAGSASHRKNMVNARLTRVGVGLARGVNATGQDCWYCVQLFLYDDYTITWVDRPIS